jgi:hypothetical protein
MSEGWGSEKLTSFWTVIGDDKGERDEGYVRRKDWRAWLEVVSGGEKGPTQGSKGNLL